MRMQWVSREEKSASNGLLNCHLQELSEMCRKEKHSSTGFISESRSFAISNISFIQCMYAYGYQCSVMGGLNCFTSVCKANIHRDFQRRFAF
ncbi:hypothetical protein TNCV_3965171 [Trichonephila clavipes]|nr:hypothetical protein TNCV_3965171 [Trichonephila clavipes]